jgi:drug/metabolite transporter (DMT)-like permease
MTPEQKQQINKKRLKNIAILGTSTALVGYSVYKIGKLPDKIPNEKGYVITGLVVGGVLFAGTTFTLSAAAPSEKAKNAAMVGSLTFMTSLGYAVTRGIFKQNPKVSLIAGAVLAAATYYVVKNPKLLQKETPKVDNTIPVTTPIAKPIS